MNRLRIWWEVIKQWMEDTCHIQLISRLTRGSNLSLGGRGIRQRIPQERCNSSIESSHKLPWTSLLYSIRAYTPTRHNLWTSCLGNLQRSKASARAQKFKGLNRFKDIKWIYNNKTKGKMKWWALRGIQRATVGQEKERSRRHHRISTL
jgi:hypothetical protein